MKFRKSILVSAFAFFMLIFTVNNASAADYNNYYTTTRINVRDAYTNQIVTTFNRGTYINGYRDNNWIYFYRDGSLVKGYVDYIVQRNPIDMRVIEQANVRNQSLSIVGRKEVGDVVYGVKIGNYYRFAENGRVYFIWHSLLVPDHYDEVTGYAVSSINVRNAATNSVIDVLPHGKYVDGHENNNYIHFNYDNQLAKIYAPLVNEDSPSTYYVRYDDTNVRDSNLNVVGTASKGDKVQAVKVGDYYRYYDNGIRLIHGTLLTSSYVAPTPKTPVSYSAQIYTLSEFRWRGIINWSGYKFTYYSQSVLPGGGLNIPGRHVDSRGYVADKDGYIVLASNKNIPRGTVINTPFGAKGKVYDRCAGCTVNWYDVYIR